MLLADTQLLQLGPGTRGNGANEASACAPRCRSFIERSGSLSLAVARSWAFGLSLVASKFEKGVTWWIFRCRSTK
jgi:hypothetical protein